MLASSFSARLSVLLLLSFSSAFASASYRRSVGFDLTLIDDGALRFLELGGGESLVFGSFDHVDGKLVGPMALLDGDGALRGTLAGQTLLGYEPQQAVKLAGGGYQIVAFPPAALWGQVLRPSLIRFSSQGQLLFVTELESMPLALLPSGKLLYAEAAGEMQLNGMRRNVSSVRRWSVDPSGKLTRDRAFGETRFVANRLEGATPLLDGSILLLGEFLWVEGAASRGQLLKLKPDGARDSSFQVSAIPPEELSLYGSAIQQTENGEVFVRREASGGRFVRLLPDGRVDAGFALPLSVLPGSGSRIVLDGGRGYYVLNCEVEGTGSKIARIDRSGALDDGFALPPGFFRWQPAHVTQLADGRLLAYGPTHPDSRPGFALVDEAGEASVFDVGGVPGRSIAGVLRWSGNGEIVFKGSSRVSDPSSDGAPVLGVARVDGSRRARFPADAPTPLYALPSGEFVSRQFAWYAMDGTAKGFHPAGETGSYLARLSDGKWLVRSTAGSPTDRGRLLRLLPDGTVDPSFEAFARAPDEPEQISIHDGYIYLPESDPADSYKWTLRRLRMDGEPDAGFAARGFVGHPSQLVATPAGVYVAGGSGGSTLIRVDGAEKPFGARFGLDGRFDPSFAPEKALRQRASSGRAFAADGSSVWLARSVASASSSAAADLWLVSPTGQATKASGPEQWMEARVDVSPRGDALLSGVEVTSAGAAAKSALYLRSPAGYSAPRYELTAYSSAPESLEATLVDAQGAAYQWRKDGRDIAGANGPSLAFDVLRPEDAGDYTLLAQVNGVRMNVGPFRLRAPFRPRFDRQPQDVSAAAGARATLSGYSEGRPEARYQWYRDGLPISGATGASLTIEPVDLSALGAYQLKASNALGVSWSQPALLKPKGIWRGAERKIFAQTLLPLQPGLRPDGQGGFWATVWRTAEELAVERYGPDGAAAGDWVANLDTGAYTGIQRGARVILYRGEPFSEGGWDFIRYHFVRLMADGSIDDAFGERSVVGRSPRSYLQLEQQTDGSVVACTEYEWKRIRADKSVHRVRWADYGIYGAYATDWRTRWMDDGSVIVCAGNRFHRVRPDGAHEVLETYRDGPEGTLGYWSSGVRLAVNRSSAAVEGRAADGSALWSLPIPEKSGGEGTWIEDFVATFDDESRRFYLNDRNHRDGETARLFWIAEDGSNNIASPLEDPALRDLTELIPTGGARFIGRFRIPSPMPARAFFEAAAIVDPDLGIGELARFYEAKSASVGRALGLASDGDLLFLQSGARVNGHDLGRIFKMSASGELDTGYSTFESLSDVGNFSSVVALRGGGVAALVSETLSKRLITLDPRGRIVADSALADGEGHRLAALPDGGFLLATELGESGLRLERYEACGALDPAYGPASIVDDGRRFRSTLLVDSTGRVYALLEAYFTQEPPGIVRLDARGKIDPTFSFSRDFQAIHCVFLDAKERLIVVASDLRRLKGDGSVDPDFGTEGLYLSSSVEALALPTGEVMVNRMIFDESGLQIGSLSYDTFPAGASISVTPRGLLGTWRPQYSDYTLLTSAVFEAPIVSRLPRSQTSRAGADVRFSLELPDSRGASVSWYRGDERLEGESDFALLLRGVSEADAGAYRAALSWPGGELLLPEFELAIGDTPALGRPAGGMAARWLGDGKVEISWSGAADARRLAVSNDLLDWREAMVDIESADGISLAILRLGRAGEPRFARLFESVEK